MKTVGKALGFSATAPTHGPTARNFSNMYAMP